MKCTICSIGESRFSRDLLAPFDASHHVSLLRTVTFACATRRCSLKSNTCTRRTNSRSTCAVTTQFVASARRATTRKMNCCVYFLAFCFCNSLFSCSCARAHTPRRYIHMRDRHFTCPVCSRHGRSDQYYNTYADLVRFFLFFCSFFFSFTLSLLTHMCYRNTTFPKTTTLACKRNAVQPSLLCLSLKLSCMITLLSLCYPSLSSPLA